MRLEPGHCGDVFPLVTLHALDQHLGLGLGFRRFGLGGRGFGFFLLGIFGGALLGVEGEGGEGGCYGFWNGGVKIVLLNCIAAARWKGASRSCSWEGYLRSIVSRAYPDGSSRAIPCISSPCRRTRSTKHASCSISLAFLSSWVFLQARYKEAKEGGIPLEAKCKLQIHQYPLCRHHVGKALSPPQYMTVRACGSLGAVSEGAASEAISPSVK